MKTQTVRNQPKVTGVEFTVRVVAGLALAMLLLFAFVAVYTFLNYEKFAPYFFYTRFNVFEKQLEKEPTINRMVYTELQTDMEALKNYMQTNKMNNLQVLRMYQVIEAFQAALKDKILTAGELNALRQMIKESGFIANNEPMIPPAPADNR